MPHFTWGDLTDPSANATPQMMPGLSPLNCQIAVPSGAQVLTVGNGEMYATLADAVAHATDGCIIRVDAGTYVNDFATVTTKITIEGVGGMAEFVATEAPPNEKGILTVDNDVNIENCGFSGCAISDADGGNGAGIRYEGGQMTLENDSFQDNQNGILGAPSILGLTNTVTVDHCLFQDNGSGTGSTHNFYMGNVSQVTFTNNISEGANVGHEFKSRAYSNDIENNVFADGPTGNASYEIDLPDGGADTVSGNVIEKGPDGVNEAMVHFGGEGIPYAGSSLLVSDNQFVNDFGPGAVAVLNQTAISADITGNEFDSINAANIASGPATETANVDGQGNTIADQTLSGVLPGNTLIISDPYQHAVTLDGSLLAVEGGAGLLKVTAVAGHVVAIGGSGGMDFTEVGYSGGNTVTTLVGSSNSLSLIGQDLVDSEGNDTITCGTGNVSGQIGGVAQVQDGTGNDQWIVSGTAVITGEGGNPVIAVGPQGSLRVDGAVGYMHVVNNGGDFAFDVVQGGAEEAITDTGGAVDVQLYNAAAQVTTAAGPTGAVIQLTTGDAQVLSAGSDVIYAGSGNDTVIVEGAATVYAGTGSMSLFGRGDTAGADFYGNGGTYLISGDTGNITYYGGSKASTVEAQLSRITLVGGSGLLSVMQGSDDAIIGGSGGLDYQAMSGAGNDTISTAVGASDSLTLGDSDFVSSYGNDVINAGSSNQQIAVYGNSTVNGSTGNSQLTFAGDDTLNGVGLDSCTVTAGADLTVNAGKLTTVSETGATVSYTDQGYSAAAATLSGGGANLVGGTWVGSGLSIWTDAGTATTVTLGEGSDAVCSYGTDTVQAGSGSSMVYLFGDGSSVAGGTGSLGVCVYDPNADDKHTVSGGTGDLNCFQGHGTLTFIGGSGNATLDGGSGSLLIQAGSGNLEVHGGQGGMSIIGGSGNLNVLLPAAGANVQFGSGTSEVQITGWGVGDTFSFLAGQGGGSDIISGFRAGTDALLFKGVGIASETVASGSTNLVLSDGTQVTLAGFTDTAHFF